MTIKPSNTSSLRILGQRLLDEGLSPSAVAVALRIAASMLSDSHQNLTVQIG